MYKVCINKPVLVAFQLIIVFVSIGSGKKPATYLPGNDTHYIGEKFGGGIVFYVYDNGQHGLIAPTSDQSAGVEWFNGINKSTGTSRDGMDSGKKNTDTIISIQLSDNTKGNFAAKVCADYSVTVGGKTYDDWYLPSKYELNLLYKQNQVVGDFDERYYWSSNEVNNEEAWLQSFYDGRQLNVSKADQNRVRAIRAF